MGHLLGSLVGWAVGIIEGSKVGFLLGEKVGLLDGLKVGRHVGNVDGCRVGKNEGWFEGLLLGTRDGSNVGFLVGKTTLSYGVCVKTSHKNAFLVLLKEQYVAVAHAKVSTAVQIVRWSRSLYVKWVEILFNIQCMVEASCFPLRELPPELCGLEELGRGAGRV